MIVRERISVSEVRVGDLVEQRETDFRVQSISTSESGKIITLVGLVEYSPDPIKPVGRMFRISKRAVSPIYVRRESD
jgi:hypothetical protein